MVDNTNILDKMKATVAEVHKCSILILNVIS